MERGLHSQAVPLPPLGTPHSSRRTRSEPAPGRCNNPFIFPSCHCLPRPGDHSGGGLHICGGLLSVLSTLTAFLYRVMIS